MQAKGKLVGGVVVLALVAAALWWWLRPAPVEDGVVFVGDSVTYLSLDDLNHDLGKKHPAYLARVGYRSRDLLPLFRKEVRRKEADGEPLRQAALLVGYNDVLRSDVESPGLEQVMDLAQRFDCAVWLLIPDIPMHEQETARWNARVREAAKRRDHVHLIDDWRKAVDGSRPGQLLEDDGVHPNTAGRARLTAIYQDAIGRSC